MANGETVLVTKLLLITHFIGLAMGFATSIANLVMLNLIAKAEPADRPVLARFPPVMSRSAEIGVTLLWLSGAALVWTKWNGFAAMPSLFHVKLVAAVLLTAALGWIHLLGARARAGDAAAAARIPAFGRVAGLSALAALILAVLTFA